MIPFPGKADWAIHGLEKPNQRYVNKLITCLISSYCYSGAGLGGPPSILYGTIHVPSLFAPTAYIGAPQLDQLEYSKAPYTTNIIWLIIFSTE